MKTNPMILWNYSFDNIMIPRRPCAGHIAALKLCSAGLPCPSRPPTMEIRQLRYFLDIARTEAPDPVGPQPVRHAVHLVARAAAGAGAGCGPVDRVGRRLQLLQAGLAFRVYAARRAGDRGRSHGAGRSGGAAVGLAHGWASSPLLHTLVPAAVAAFSRSLSWGKRGGAGPALGPSKNNWWRLAGCGRCLLPHRTRGHRHRALV